MPIISIQMKVMTMANVQMTMIALMTTKKNAMLMMMTFITTVKIKRIKGESSPYNVDKDCKG